MSEKMNLKANRELDLSLFVYIVRNGQNVIVPMPQDVKMITAYTDEEAIANISSQYPPGTPLTIDPKGKMPMKQLLDAFNKTIERGESTNTDSTKAKEKTKVDWYGEFLTDIVTIANERYQGKKKKFESLQEIINDLRPLVTQAQMWEQVNQIKP